MDQQIKDWFTRFRLRLASFFIKSAINVIDKNTIEGMALVISVDEWVKYLNSVYDKIPANKK